MWSSPVPPGTLRIAASAFSAPGARAACYPCIIVLLLFIILTIVR